MGFSEARHRGLPALLALCAGLWLAAVSSASADARTDYLVRLLTGSSQFRVRAQAAISLGNVEVERAAVDALVRALRDEHPAVRAAAANSLGRLGELAEARAALQSAAEDREAPVRVAARAALAKLRSAAGTATEATAAAKPLGPPRYYVAVGRPSTQVPSFPRSMLETAERLLRQRLSEMNGVVLASGDEGPAEVSAVLRRRRLRGFYIESAVTSLEDKPDGGTRVAVSVILATYPGRDMRAILRGAATAMGGSDQRAQALTGAIKSALRQLPQAMQRP